MIAQIVAMPVLVIMSYDLYIRARGAYDAERARQGLPPLPEEHPFERKAYHFVTYELKTDAVDAVTQRHIHRHRLCAGLALANLLLLAVNAMTPWG